MRAKYDDAKEDNPIQQVYGYIDDIKAGKIKDRHDRLITLKPNALFFAYILCDPTPKIENYARIAQFKRTPDNSGWFTYNENYPAWVEIIPFDKLLSDAKKRNRILFDKLNLPYS
jgi:hypothetical protein